MAQRTSNSTDVCPCDDDCPQTLEALERLEDMTPRSAVAAAAKVLPTAPFLKLVAAEAGVDPCYRLAGAADMFIQHIINGRKRDDFPYWYYPLTGIVNIWDAISEDESEIRDAVIIQRMRTAYSKILDVIWDDLHLLTDSSHYMADEWKAIVSMFFKFYLSDLQSKRKLYERRAMFLVAHCWCETSLDSRHQDVALEGIFELWELGRHHYPKAHLEMFFDVVDLDQIVTHLKRIFDHKDCVGYTLAMEMQAVVCLVDDGKNSRLLASLIECNFYKQVIKATRRELKSGEEENIDLVLRNASLILLDILDKTPHSSKFLDTYTDILDNRWVVEAGSTALIRAHRSNEHDLAKPWCKFFTGICHILDCNGSQQCPSCKMPPPASFVNAARASFERIAIPTAVALGEESRYAALWTNLLSYLDITPESVRERYRLDKKCCNLDCPMRNSGHRSEKKATCVRCQSVFYCDRSCQKSDWPNHKLECQKLAERQKDPVSADAEKP